MPGIRDYHMGFLVIARSTRDPIIKPESFSLKADNGRGLTLRAMTKIPCYNLFITNSKTLFQAILIKKKSQEIINFYYEIEELRHKIRVTSFCQKSYILWHAYNDNLFLF